LSDRFSKIARALVAEHAAGTPFRAFAAEASIGDLAAAYDAQAAFVACLAAPSGATPVGYKIGLTSARMQAMCGIGHPIAGTVLSSRVLATGARLDPARYGRLGIEFEIAVKLSRDLAARDAPFEMADIAAAVGAVCPAIEIVDDRNAEYASLDVLSLVADNSWNAGVVLSEFRETWPALDTVVGTVTRNGEFLDRGTGADVLGHPFAPLVWLANHLAERGQALKAGDVVMTGSIVTTKFPVAGESYRFELGRLGAVEVRIV
jgi:2-keto-4-pentenoate hydratase